MTAFVRSGIARRRRPFRLLLAGLVTGLFVSAGDLPVAGPTARADQTITFDGAGGAPHISLVGDSTLTGVRWYADYGALERFNFVLSAESCRRTIERSCFSREGYRSENVVTAMRTIGGDLGEVLVVMSGYNDPLWTIDEAIAGVVEEARGLGVDHVVWLTLRAGQDVNYSDPQEQTSVDTFQEYNRQLVEAASSSGGYLQVADWATYSGGATAWFEADGVHLTPRGVDALTTFVAGTVERVLAGQDVSPAAAPWTVLVPGAEGEVVTAVQSALLDAGIELPGGADGVYGNDTMAAVAVYQQDADGLQVTGAVDAATARSLGVYDEVADDAPSPSSASSASAAAPTTASAADGAASGEVAEAAGAERDRRWVFAVGAVVVAGLVAAVVGRRRWVVAARGERRWARVHPSTSPHRSIADLRRSGELPVVEATPPARRDERHEPAGSSRADR